MRTRLDPRHRSETVKVNYLAPSGAEMSIIATFGFDDQGRIKEVFCAGFKKESDVVALANDASILMSRCLQHGDSLEELSAALGENRVEGQPPPGLPSSIIGAIARAGLAVRDG